MGKVRVRSRWARVARYTVWHPINTDPADENRWGPRFWYPTYDIIALTLGLIAFWQGSPLLNRLFPDWFTDFMAVGLIAASIICLVGVVIPRLALAELVGKLSIVFLLGGYAGTVAFMGNQNENGFVVVVLIMSVWLLGPRASELFVRVPKTMKQNRQKRLERRAVR